MNSPYKQNPTSTPPRSVPNVVVLALPGTTLSSIAAAVDVFTTAGTMWNKIMGLPSSSVFNVKVVSPNGKPIPCVGVPSVGVHTSMHDIENPDLIIVSALIANSCVTEQFSDVLHWLSNQHQKGAAIASLCTGAFVLAATGLLNGKTATTHWGVAKTLQAMYPKVKVTPHRLITDEQTLFTSGGTHGALDLCLYLVEKFSTRDIALKCAKVLVRDFDLRSQLPYAVFVQHHQHGDNEIKQVQDFVDGAYDTPLSVNELAKHVGLSRRTFERRFRLATGSSPNTYVQNVRIEAAKRILETENRTVEQITDSVGYGDPAAFSKLFSKICGISPTTYRKKFSPNQFNK